MTRRASARSRRRSPPPPNCPATAGSAACPKTTRGARSSGCSPRCAGRCMRARSIPAPPTRAMASKPSWPIPTPRWSPPPRRRATRSRRCCARCWRSASGSTRWSTIRPTGSTDRRGRASTGRGTASARASIRSAAGCRCSGASAVRPTPISSIGSRSTATTGASSTPGCTATGSTPRGRLPTSSIARRRACWSPRQRYAAAMVRAAGPKPTSAPARATWTAASSISRCPARSTMPASRKC